MNDGISFVLNPNLYVYTSNSDFNYSAKIDSVELEINAVLLNDKVGYLFG
jgi:hypothetical protein